MLIERETLRAGAAIIADYSTRRAGPRPAPGGCCPRPRSAREVRRDDHWFHEKIPG